MWWDSRTVWPWLRWFNRKLSVSSECCNLPVSYRVMSKYRVYTFCKCGSLIFSIVRILTSVMFLHIVLINSGEIYSAIYCNSIRIAISNFHIMFSDFILIVAFCVLCHLLLVVSVMWDMFYGQEMVQRDFTSRLINYLGLYHMKLALKLMTLIV